ncbi:MAG TPA: hypothetical protein VGS19_00065, partial [Streptosporangiaceae bacterium]|nr:hypothetical protein [Streptosporangiaceae bacterium]
MSISSPPQPRSSQWLAEERAWHLPENSGTAPAPVRHTPRHRRPGAPPQEVDAVLASVQEHLDEAAQACRRAQEERAAAEAAAREAARQRAAIESATRKLAELQAALARDRAEAAQDRAEARARLTQAQSLVESTLAAARAANRKPRPRRTAADDTPGHEQRPDPTTV